MFKHEKMLFHPVGVEKPNPQYAALLQEQLGGANGELKAAMQYMSQSFRIKDQNIKDLFLDIAAEELGHMEMVAQTINLLNGHDVDAAMVPAGEIQTHVLLGLNPGLINASGYSWTSDYVTVTGDLCADLLSNIASEQRAKVVYEYLYRQIDDKKVKETIDFLLNREEAHNAMFREAFNTVQNTGSNQDFGTTKAAKMYFSMSEPSPQGSPFIDTEVAPPAILIFRPVHQTSLLQYDREPAVKIHCLPALFRLPLEPMNRAGISQFTLQRSIQRRQADRQLQARNRQRQWPSMLFAA